MNFPQCDKLLLNALSVPSCHFMCCLWPAIWGKFFIGKSKEVVQTCVPR